MTAKTRTILWITLSAALIVAGITAAWAQTQTWRGVHAPFWFHHGPMGYIAGELELNDNQKAQIRTIWEGERPNIAGLVHEFASEQREMDAMRSKGEPADDATIQEITAREGATLARLFAEKEKITGKIYYQVLDPAQRTKADELLKRWSSHLDHAADRIGNGITNK